MAIAFRSAQFCDVDLLLTFMQELSKQDYGEFREESARSAVERLLQNSSLGQIWLIWLEERAIGYAVLTLGYSLEFLGRDAFVDELFIQADYRGRGIGTQALHFLEDRCRELGVRALHLEVEHRNLKAQRFYQKAGFCDRHFYLMTKNFNDKQA